MQKATKDLEKAQPQKRNGGLNGALRPGVEEWIMKDGVRLGAMLADSVHRIDMMIYGARDILESAQPSLPGKISVRWWEGRNGGRKEPYVFRWEQKKNGDWTAKTLPLQHLSKRAIKTGPFAAGRGEVEQALSAIQSLMKVRQDLLAAYGSARQILANKGNGIDRLLEKAESELQEPYRRAQGVRQERANRPPSV